MSAAARLTPRQKIEQGIAAWERNAYLEAVVIFNEVIREHPDFPDVHNRVGLCKAMLGNLEGALHAFESALELAPSYAEAHFNRGIVLNELGRHEDAEEAFRQAHELDTRDGRRFPSQLGNEIADAHARLGDLYLLAESFADAVQQYRAALEVRPRFVDVRERLARALLALGRAEDARRELERAVDEDPDFADARLRLGVTLRRLGDAEGAIREWRRVLTLRPDDRRGRAYLAYARAVSETGRPEANRTA